MCKKEITIKTNRTINHMYAYGKESSVPTFFLHGFTGSSKSWQDVIAGLEGYSVSIDLPGHGKSVFKNLNLDYSIDNWCEDFIQIINALDIKKINLCGYSMGGRLAIAFASKYPQKINKLILESASYGIENKDDQELRFQEDLKLCGLIETDFHKFIQKWENSPLFLKQKDRNPDGFLKQREERLLHDSDQISKALRSFSQGCMDFYMEAITKFDFPIVIVNGLEDNKYVEMGKRITQINNKSIQYIIKGSNHNVHLESMNAFIRILQNDKV